MKYYFYLISYAWLSSAPHSPNQNFSLNSLQHFPADYWRDNGFPFQLHSKKWSIAKAVPNKNESLSEFLVMGIIDLTNMTSDQKTEKLSATAKQQRHKQSSMQQQHHKISSMQQQHHKQSSMPPKVKTKRDSRDRRNSALLSHLLQRRVSLVMVGAVLITSRIVPISAQSIGDSKKTAFVQPDFGKSASRSAQSEVNNSLARQRLLNVFSAVAASPAAAASRAASPAAVPADAPVSGST